MSFSFDESISKGDTEGAVEPPSTAASEIADPIPDRGVVLDPPANQSAAGANEDRAFWPSFLMAVALTSIAIGITWDISWHESIGRDTFWTPAHMAIYLGGVLAGCTGGWLALKCTFFGNQADRESSVSVFGARAPIGAWVAMWGALAMITSAPFDDWWHNAYGLDVKIISPPHAVLGFGMFAISVGAILLVLSRQNRLHDVSPKKGSGLFIYTGGVFVLLGSVFLLEYIWPNQQHTPSFLVVCAIMYPARLVALSIAGRASWPATKVAAVYMGMLCVIDWVLGLFPATPLLAPIFNPITHMVALPFPLLLIFPAIGVDLLVKKTAGVHGSLRLVGASLGLGAVFLALLAVVQWYFAKFLLSPHAQNWFFMSDRIWSYSSPPGEWRMKFWSDRPRSDTPPTLSVAAITLSWVIASFSSGLGIFFGRWMRKVRR